MNCTTCGHATGWHLFADGPHPRICNKPKCECKGFTQEEVSDV